MSELKVGDQTEICVHCYFYGNGWFEYRPVKVIRLNPLQVELPDHTAMFIDPNVIRRKPISEEPND